MRRQQLIVRVFETPQKEKHVEIKSSVHYSNTTQFSRRPKEEMCPNNKRPAVGYCCAIENNHPPVFTHSSIHIDKREESAMYL